MDQRERLRVREETMWLKTVKKRGRVYRTNAGKKLQFSYST